MMTVVPNSRHVHPPQQKLTTSKLIIGVSQQQVFFVKTPRSGILEIPPPLYKYKLILSGNKMFLIYSLNLNSNILFCSNISPL